MTVNIIAVNIGLTYNHKSHYQATRRVWTLNINNVKKHDPEFVVGIDNGKVISVFKYVDVFEDDILNDPTKVEFQLCPCNDIEMITIKKAVESQCELKYKFREYLTIEL